MRVGLLVGLATNGGHAAAHRSPLSAKSYLVDQNERQPEVPANIRYVRAGIDEPDYLCRLL